MSTISRLDSSIYDLLPTQPLLTECAGDRLDDTDQ